MVSGGEVASEEADVATESTKEYLMSTFLCILQELRIDSNQLVT